MSRRLVQFAALIIASSLLAGCFALPGASSPTPAISLTPASPSSAPSDIVNMPEYIPSNAVVTEPAELARLDRLFAPHLQSDDLLQYVILVLQWDTVSHRILV